ncbi:cytochrome c4 [Sphingomonas prati]|uniref:NAD(P)/FAD-dependent oxidoreductase n=1 Tax=Sphingomonas prati TaxID=1843237 RepID=UPI00198B4416|nr:FAD-binding oxidoreductase [Sphingomonas prati]GGE94301.1 cytochrome c4 [Sphingomonas prati]
MGGIGIVGGGIVGLSCALAMLDRGRDVTLFERAADYNAASWGNAGHIAVEQVAPLASPAALRSAPSRLFGIGGALALPPSMIGRWLPFVLRLAGASTPGRFAAGTTALTPLLAGAMPAWRDLAAAIGMPDLLREDGHIVIWDTPATARRGRERWSRTAIGTARIIDAEPGMLQRLGTLTEHVGGAIRFTGSGQIADLRRLAITLEAAVVARGGRIVRQDVRLIETAGRIAVAGHDIDQVLVAAGVRSRALLEPLGYRVPMIAERGYHVRARADRWPADLPPVVFEDRSMIVSRYADCVQAASFVELGDPDAPPDPRKWERLEHHIRTLGLPIAGPYDRWMGARPTLPDYLPAIGRSARHANLIYAFGHQHLGLTLAPVTAQLVAALMLGQTPSIPLDPFDLHRFGNTGRHP